MLLESYIFFSSVCDKVWKLSVDIFKFIQRTEPFSVDSIYVITVPESLCFLRHEIS